MIKYKQFVKQWTLITILLVQGLRRTVVSSFSLSRRPRVSSSFPFSHSFYSYDKPRSKIWLGADRKKIPFFANERKEEKKVSSESSSNIIGKVIRLAAKEYDADKSKPSSREYTTKKQSKTSIRVAKGGVQGDYNHYRTVALKSTNDRAISILTRDVMDALRSNFIIDDNNTNSYKILDGDLGENILLDNVQFHFFRVGQRYQFVGDGGEGGDTKRAVIIEITEPMEPCANLCKLPYINDESAKPKERIQKCQDFIEFLNQYDGYRGWYAKVCQEGVINTGDRVIKCL